MPSQHLVSETNRRSIAFELLERDHSEVDALLGELADQSADRDRARRMAAEALRAHMAMEEAVFYAALDNVGALHSFVERMRTQHRLIREALDTVCREPIGSPAFEQALERLDRLVDEHVQEEEMRAFAYAAEHLAGELEALAVEMEHRRQCERGAYGVG
jgi:hypothetical protein